MLASLREYVTASLFALLKLVLVKVKTKQQLKCAISLAFIPHLVVVSIFGAQIHLPLFVRAIKQKLAVEEGVINNLCFSSKFSHRGIGMEMLGIGMAAWDQN